MTAKAGKTALVVEDDNFLIKAYEAHLAKAGFHVRTALDGVEAVESLKKVMPDIILLDLVMPRMDGFDVLEEMQKKI